MFIADVYYRKSDHLVRLMTGLHLLEKQGLIQCRYIRDDDYQVLPCGAFILEMRIAGKRIAFDMSDASGLYQEHVRNYLDQVDVYFERSHIDWGYLKVLEGSLQKIHPFGFNYYTTYRGNPAFLPSQSGSILKRAVRDYLNNSSCTRVEAFEGTANFDPLKKPNIVFMTRLWDPADVKITAETPASDREYREKRIAERRVINAERIQICRMMKSIYGANFYGGIQKSNYAIKQCPDLVLPTRATLKTNYLYTMKKADICIGSSGLEHSIGWKTGEYVAAARAIVCEELIHSLPGGFREGINFLSYCNVDSCLSAVEKLVNDPERILQMQHSNEAYYKSYLRPDIQILNALRSCDILI